MTSGSSWPGWQSWVSGEQCWLPRQPLLSWQLALHARGALSELPPQACPAEEHSTQRAPSQCCGVEQGMTGLSQVWVRGSQWPPWQSASARQRTQTALVAVVSEPEGPAAAMQNGVSPVQAVQRLPQRRSVLQG